MMTPELRYAKALWREVFAMGTLSEAKRFLIRIEKAIADNDHSLKWPLWIAFVVSYAKPFTDNKDIGKISDKAVPDHLKELHHAFIKARNLLYGHTDPLETLADGGQANQISIHKKGESFEIRPNTLVPEDIELPRAKELVDSLLADLTKRTQLGIDELIANIREMPDGDYLFPYPNLPKSEALKL